MKILVVGAGIFGCTVATHLSRKGYVVDLADKQDSIMRGATTANQLRLHRGFHYPRSPETIEECQRGVETFREEYGAAVDYGGQQFYAISREGSKTNAQQYIHTCVQNDLTLINAAPPFDMFYDYIDGIWEVSEAHINLPVLRNMVQFNLWHSGVNVYLNQEVTKEDFKDYDKVILATYGQTSWASDHLPFYNFELIEKPVVRLWEENWKKNSLVVLDGPFFSIDPLLGTSYHLLGHVDHCIHAYYEGFTPNFWGEAIPIDLVNKGLIRADYLAGISAIDHFVGGLEGYIGGDLEHVGSYFTIRVVKAGVDDTDERPTIVTQIDDKLIDVFSGKIGCCVDAAMEVVDLCSQ